MFLYALVKERYRHKNIKYCNISTVNFAVSALFKKLPVFIIQLFRFFILFSAKIAHKEIEPMDYLHGGANQALTG